MQRQDVYLGQNLGHWQLWRKSCKGTGGGRGWDRENTHGEEAQIRAITVIFASRILEITTLCIGVKALSPCAAACQCHTGMAEWGACGKAGDYSVSVSV